MCRQFVGLMIFRDPLARLESHIRWVLKFYRDFYNGTDISKAFK